MNAVLEYLLPLPSVRRRQARTVLGLWLTGLIATLVLLACFHGQDRHGEPMARIWMSLYAFGLALVWLMMPAGSLLLAMDSHQLRIPGGVRRAFSSLPWFAILCTVPASLMFHAYGISFWTSILSMLVACTVGLIFTWMPRRWALSICFAPAIFNGLGLHKYIHAISTLALNGWLSVALLTLVGLASLLARHYLRHGMPEEGNRSPMVIQYRSASSGWAHLGSRLQIKQTAGWLRPMPDLRRAGPGRTMPSLRILLGGGFDPMRWPYYLNRALLLVGVFLLLLVMQVLSDLPLHSFKNFVHPAKFSATVTGFLAGVLPMLVLLPSIIPFNIVKRRWSQPGHELAMLALMPGLDHGQSLNRALLHTLLWSRPARIQAALLLCSLVFMLIWPAQATAAALFSLLVLTTFAATISGCLHVISQAPSSGRIYQVLIPVGGLLLFCFGLFLPMALLDADRHIHAGWTYPLMLVDILAQLATILILIIVACRCWHRLQAMPHPFLAR